MSIDFSLPREVLEMRDRVWIGTIELALDMLIERANKPEAHGG